MPQERAEAVAIVREQGTNRGFMVGHAAPIGAAILNDERSRHAVGRPAELAPDQAGELSLAAKRADHLADIDDLGLDLDDQQRASWCVPGEDVDEATVAAEIERRLGAGLPSELDERQYDRLDEPCVLGCRKSVQIAVA